MTGYEVSPRRPLSDAALPWVRVLLLIRSIISTIWGHETWPLVKPVAPARPGDAPADRAGRLVELTES